MWGFWRKPSNHEHALRPELPVTTKLTTRLPNYKAKQSGPTPNHLDPALASTPVEPKQNPLLSPIEQALRGEQRFYSSIAVDPYIAALSDTRFYYPLARTKSNLRLTPVQLTIIGSQAWNCLTQHRTSSCQTHHGCRNTRRNHNSGIPVTRIKSSHTDQILKVLIIAMCMAS